VVERSAAESKPVHQLLWITLRTGKPPVSFGFMAFTYILECADGSYYVGSTTDLERRVAQHAAGEGAAYTRRRRPVKLAWSMQMDSIAEAYYLEKKLQGWSRAKRRCVVEGRYADLKSNMKE
jgi:putative endonuclease